MYISYDKLWVILAERKITKTEFCELAGLSTRTVANMTKNRDVSLYSLGKICTALHCEVSDIVTFSEKPDYHSVFDVWQASAPIGEDEMLKYYKVNYNNTDYDIAVTKKTADRYTVVKCYDNSVVWEQIPFYAMETGQRYGESLPEFEIKPREKQTGVIRVIVISGKPHTICGLDEGIVRSSRNPGSDRNIHVMSMAAFKLFDINCK